MHVLNILWVVFGIGLMLVLNLKFKINSMVALLVAALSVGMLAGMDLMSLLHTMKAGFGNTLGELAIIVVFGAVIGKLMVDSGAAHQIAHTLPGASRSALCTAVGDYHRLDFRSGDVL
ncbi:high-affinity gluconate transporter [Escherichia coli]|uniref:High-affinity gluconate transporter n=1 Tax=Escherichia coli TaxID=562 RepID=A0A376RRN5_ECOLX|nr:high-affinity gluconate transporter [Escherichia coli]